nr:helix-turn-helix domain-containing protein [Mycolicibacterium porcinum]
MRFSELQAALPGVGAKMLTKTLRRLEAASLVERTVYAEVPPRVEYSLTKLGISVNEPLAQIRAWAEDNIDTIDSLNPHWDVPAD